MDSNISIGSNVYHIIEADGPLFDEEFLGQIQDYDLLKNITVNNRVKSSSLRLNAKQVEILQTELRCINAKHDPCWGYSDQKNQIVCACVNNDCPKIKVCNPNFSPKEAAYWVASANEAAIYGNPAKQSEYYFVDMISDAEMKSYDVDPMNDGVEHPVIKDQRLESGQKKSLLRAELEVGREQTIVGKRRQIVGKGENQREEIIDIWGFVHDVTPQRSNSRKKAKRLEKIEPVTIPKIKVVPKKQEEAIDQDYLNKDKFEERVSELVSDEIKLTDIVEQFDENSRWLLVLSNPAEEAYVSSMLLKDNLNHGFTKKDQIELALVEKLNDVSADVIFVSNNVLKTGCLKENVKGWKKLAEASALIKLTISDRDFFDFNYGDGQHRWTCRNMYGVTHVCVESEDVTSLNANDGIYDVSLVEDGNSYQILKKDATPLGNLGPTFADVITALKKAGEIENTPAYIEGVSIEVKEGKTIVLGMGHLKFMEY